MNPDLKPEEFPDFFKAVHDVMPFPWQERLGHRVFNAGWPSALDIPTGAGKTAAIDIAVFHLALEVEQERRRAADRIVFIVDRRLIVDDAFERGRRIAECLVSAKEGILKRVGDRLRCLAEDGGPPLAVVRLRGGMPKEPDWVRTPAQPTVIVSTVDQAGSRLLFRGYGVSDTMKPVHAGLLGSDALLLLDEAHLSQPFVQTVRDSSIFRSAPWTENSAPAPFGAVTLSATQQVNRDSGEEAFTISDDDHNDARLAKRLSVSKPAELIEAKSETDLLEHLAKKAWEFASANNDRVVVAVVVNRVRRAREVFDALCRKGGIPLLESVPQDGSVPHTEVALLIGRVRDIDRDLLLEKLLPDVRAGRPKKERTSSLIVVATQCIEAGADLDFDSMVTEIAPLDCLRQRFGRLNRMGRDINTRAAIIAATDQVKKTSNDPIYGGALRSTWSLLNEKSPSKTGKKAVARFIDFGIKASQSWLPEGSALNECLSPRKDAPVLLPGTIESWNRTSPIPAADPEVCLYLHGPETGPADVSIIWRRDINDDLPPDAWVERVAVCPPAAAEGISVPLAEARRWLLENARGEIGDTEVAGQDNPIESNTSELKALRWRGPDDTKPDLTAGIGPGDVIVVPASRGGCDQWGWNPASNFNVTDLGREANRRQRGRDILRLTNASPELGESEIAASEMSDWSDREIREHFAKYFADLDQRGLRRMRVIRSKEGRPLAVERKLFTSQQKESRALGEAVTEDDESLHAFAQRPVLLCDHSRGVETYARQFARQAGLPSAIVDDVALAAYIHDAGKAHPDFKRFLYGGDELASVGGPDLAKSAKLPGSPRIWDQVRRLAGLPKGARHEVASLRFAEAHPRFATAHDPILVIWLIGTHHGYGRPFFHAPERDWPGEGAIFETDLGDGKVLSKPALSLAQLTARWFDIYEIASHRYGAWGLARLESILRLADHRRSEAEQEEDGSQ